VSGMGKQVKKFESLKVRKLNEPMIVLLQGSKKEQTAYLQTYNDELKKIDRIPNKSEEVKAIKKIVRKIIVRERYLTIKLWELTADGRELAKNIPIANEKQAITIINVSDNSKMPKIKNAKCIYNVIGASK